jgi:hypothetical protein
MKKMDKTAMKYQKIVEKLKEMLSEQYYQREGQMPLEDRHAAALTWRKQLKKLQASILTDTPSSEMLDTEEKIKKFKQVVKTVGTRDPVDITRIQDDFAENVEGCQAVGMHGIHFRDPHKTMIELRILLDGK